MLRMPSALVGGSVRLLRRVYEVLAQGLRRRVGPHGQGLVPAVPRARAERAAFNPSRFYCCCCCCCCCGGGRPGRGLPDRCGGQRARDPSGCGRGPVKHLLVQAIQDGAGAGGGAGGGRGRWASGLMRPLRLRAARPGKRRRCSSRHRHRRQQRAAVEPSPGPSSPSAAACMAACSAALYSSCRKPSSTARNGYGSMSTAPIPLQRGQLEGRAGDFMPRQLKAFAPQRSRNISLHCTKPD